MKVRIYLFNNEELLNYSIHDTKLIETNQHLNAYVSYWLLEVETDDITKIRKRDGSKHLQPDKYIDKGDYIVIVGWK